VATPVEVSHARMKPLALANDHHGRCMAVAPERTPFSVRECPSHATRHKFITVSLLKRPRNGSFTSETAARQSQK
jgi:hypothetical protein